MFVRSMHSSFLAVKTPQLLLWHRNLGIAIETQGPPSQCCQADAKPLRQYLLNPKHRSFKELQTCAFMTLRSPNIGYMHDKLASFIPHSKLALHSGM